MLNIKKILKTLLVLAIIPAMLDSCAPPGRGHKPPKPPTPARP